MMEKVLTQLLQLIYTEADGDDQELIDRAVHALEAAKYKADRDLVQGALTTCNDAESFSWDLVRAAGVPET